MAKENNNTAFKSTPIGMIPMDWDIIQIGEVGTLFKGKGIAKTEVVEEGLPCIRYAELYTKYNTKFTNTFSFCNEESALLSQKIINGDIVFAGSGETLEDIGKCAVYLGDSVAYAGGDTIILRPEKVDSTYLSYLLNYDSVVKQRSVLGQGNSVVHIYPKGIATILVQIPPTKEQTKIAQILSTWDVSIETLQLLIAKKERRKKALMQKLLTGKIRFKEFKGEKWKSISIKELGKVFSGGTPDTNIKEYFNGNIFWVTPTEITKLLGVKYISSTERKISELGLKNSSANLLPSNSLIVCTRATVGHCAINTIPMATNQGFKSIVPNSIVTIDFLYYKFSTLKNELIKLASGSTFLEVSKNDFESIKIKIPIDHQEQKQIASVLSSADEEIQTLKIQLAHYKQQKQGLMQVLLTGKKRVKI